MFLHEYRDDEYKKSSSRSKVQKDLRRARLCRTELNDGDVRVLEQNSTGAKAKAKNQTREKEKNTREKTHEENTEKRKLRGH